MAGERNDLPGNLSNIPGPTIYTSAGEVVDIKMINLSDMAHPMHIHWVLGHGG